MHHEQLLQNSCNTVFPKDMICFRNESVNTLHKAGGGGGDDDVLTIIRAKNLNKHHIIYCQKSP
jgi:hypothetical protein